jgi:hypothetical protein
MIHDLKTWPAYFAVIADGSKTFEIRRNDRNFQIGDTLRLREYSLASKEYTGQEVSRIVTYVLPAERFTGITSGFCVMGMKPLPDTTNDTPAIQQLSGYIKQLAKNVRQETPISQYKRGNRFVEKSIPINVDGR